MPDPNETAEQIHAAIGFLVEKGLADNQRTAFRRSLGNGIVEITFEGANHVSVALRDRAYSEIYRHLSETRAFNAKLPDGALLQMMYRYSNNLLESHRLAFFPSPSLDEFQNDPEIYLEDVAYADVVARNIVPFPLRFDYNDLGTVDHPKCHLTLGQYERCRIPVTAPMAPLTFIDFLLRNFYNTAFVEYAEALPTHTQLFDETIRPSERNMVHVTIPHQPTSTR